MFVDDNLWPTRSAGSLEEVARMHETFCDFHKVFIHKTKSEYMTVNGKGVQVRWRPTGEDQAERAHKEGTTVVGANATTTEREEREGDGGETVQAESSGGLGDTGEGQHRGGAGIGGKGGGRKEGQQGSSRGSTKKGKLKGRKGDKGSQLNQGGPRDEGQDTRGREGQRRVRREGGEDDQRQGDTRMSDTIRALVQGTGDGGFAGEDLARPMPGALAVNIREAVDALEDETKLMSDGPLVGLEGVRVYEIDMNRG